MSTTAKGNEFEKRVYDALAAELKNECLCASPKYGTIFSNKAYYSRDRDSQIITDVSIEVFLPDRERPSIIWVFECKDYSGSIPVDDIEEFHSKLQQIGEDNTKGTFVTSGALQRGAMNFALSKGIGVIRLLPSNQIEVVLELMTTAGVSRPVEVEWSEFDAALLNPEHRSRRSFFGFQDGYWFGSLNSLLSHFIAEQIMT